LDFSTGLSVDVPHVCGEFVASIDTHE